MARRPVTSRPRSAELVVPQRLIEEINGGRCIAFVGAGFSAAARFPAWRDLLAAIAALPDVPQEVRHAVLDRIATGSTGALDAAAQMLEDALGRAPIVAELRRVLSARRMPATMRRRLGWLAGIPFRGVLTTNYDPLLRGDVACAASYREILRPSAPAWREHAFWDAGLRAPTVKLHGDVSRVGDEDGIVLTRRDYRRRLYGDAAYATFVRSLMATSTLLYLGVSFQDAYLNELRSEVLSLLAQSESSAPVAYAVVNDVPELIVEHFRRHEGIEILSYDSRGGSDHGGFDAWLRAIYRATSPVVRFGRYLRERRILWVDPRPESYREARAFFDAAAREAGPGGHAVIELPNADVALRRLRARPEEFDLVITHWGEGDARDESAPCATAERLLLQIRRDDIRVPVVVFTRKHDVERRKARAQRLGAQGCCWTFQALFRTIESLFTPGRESGSE